MSFMEVAVARVFLLGYARDERPDPDASDDGQIKGRFRARAMRAAICAWWRLRKERCGVSFGA